MKINSGLKFILVLSLFVSSCLVPFRSFKHTKQPSPPDYANRLYWASLPDKKDSSDFELKEKNAKADVFFIPPTNYLNGYKWNANVNIHWQED